MRVQAVVQELHGEKMDVVMWAEDPEAFLMNALSPAKPTRVVKDDAARTMIAVATDHNQLTHLIGRGGQNARLASKLTGWKVDIMTEAELRGGPVAVADAAVADGGTEAVAAAEPGAAEPATDATAEAVLATEPASAAESGTPEPAAPDAAAEPKPPEPGEGGS
jgi:N utilization substance protein A